jgi:hypothetical protein
MSDSLQFRLKQAANALAVKSIMGKNDPTVILLRQAAQSLNQALGQVERLAEDKEMYKAERDIAVDICERGIRHFETLLAVDFEDPTLTEDEIIAKEQANGGWIRLITNTFRPPSGEEVARKIIAERNAGNGSV